MSFEVGIEFLVRDRQRELLAEARRERLARAAREVHPKTDWKLDAVARNRAFEGVPRRDLPHIAAQLDELRAPARSVLMVEGRLNHSFFLLVEGTCEVLVGPWRKGILQANDFFGESSMESRGAASATVEAVTPVRLLVASHRQYAFLHPYIGRRSIAPVAPRRRHELSAAVEGGRF